MLWLWFLRYLLNSWICGNITSCELREKTSWYFCMVKKVHGPWKSVVYRRWLWWWPHLNSNTYSQNILTVKHRSDLHHYIYRKNISSKYFLIELHIRSSGIFQPVNENLVRDSESVGCSPERNEYAVKECNT